MFSVITLYIYSIFFFTVIIILYLANLTFRPTTDYHVNKTCTTKIAATLVALLIPKRCYFWLET